MNNYLIIADDFTGANDTGVQIRRRGIPVNVVFSGAGITGGGSWVIDTESRFLSEAASYQKLVMETEKIPFASFNRAIKKVDSTLRGNIGAETKALAQTFKPEIIVFAPALPDLGRTTVNRIHCLNGTPISKTEPAHDPKTPVTNDDVQKIMSAAFGDDVTHIDLNTLRNNPDVMRNHFDVSRNGNTDTMRVFTFDAETNGDLQTIARIVRVPEKRVLWVGSAGLADNLLSAEIPVLPALAVIASLSSVSRNQVRYAEKQGVTLVKVPLYAILERKTSTEKIAGEAISFLDEGRDCILLSSSTYSVDEYQRTEGSARRSELSTEEMSAFTQKIMGQIALMVLEKAKVSGLFLSGGDTAISCFEHAGAVGSTIVTEIAVGIPLTRMIGGRFDGLKVVTKAGAFGNEDAVYYGLRKLREGG